MPILDLERVIFMKLYIWNNKHSERISVTFSFITKILEYHNLTITFFNNLKDLYQVSEPFYLIILLDQLNLDNDEETMILKNIFHSTHSIPHLQGVLCHFTPKNIQSKNALLKSNSQLGEQILESRHTHYHFLLKKCVIAHRINRKSQDDPALILNADEAIEIIYDKQNRNHIPLYQTEDEKILCLFDTHQNLILCSSLKFIYPEHIASEDNLSVFVHLIFQLMGKTIDQETKLLIKKELCKHHPDSYKNAPIRIENPDALFQKQYKTLSINFEASSRPSEQYCSQNPYENFEEFLLGAQLYADQWPDSIKNCLREFKRNGNYYGGLLLKNLPLDRNLCATPSEPSAQPLKKSFVSEFILCAVSNFLGDPFTYYQERKENLFHNICPSFKNKDKISSESSEINLDFHSEIIFHPFSPDYLLLYCLRQDPEKMAQTSILSIDQLFPHIPLGYRSILFEERFITGIDYSFGSINGVKGNGLKRAVLYGDPKTPYFRCDFDLMIGADPEAQETLDFLKQLSQSIRTSIILEPGDLLIIDNHKALHARSAFQAHYDGRDRWLQRLLISSNLQHIKHNLVFEGRIVDVNFAL